MRRVYKYRIPMLDEFQLVIPRYADILTVQTQGGEDAFIWARVDDRVPNETRTFHLHGTGHAMHEKADVYIGTFQLAGGSLVFHLFEEERPDVNPD